MTETRIWEEFYGHFLRPGDGPLCGPWCRRPHGPDEPHLCELPSKREIVAIQKWAAEVDRSTPFGQRQAAQMHQRWRCLLAMMPGPDEYVPAPPRRSEFETYAKGIEWQRKANALRKQAYRRARERLAAYLGRGL